MSDDNPFGDDAGTRVGRPDTPKRDNIKPDHVKPEVPRTDSVQRDNVGDESGGSTTGAGAEAARGIHSVNKKGSTEPNSKPGSEPLDERANEHKSGYGGDGGQPRTSSDKR